MPVMSWDHARERIDSWTPYREAQKWRRRFWLALGCNVLLMVVCWLIMTR